MPSVYENSLDDSFRVGLGWWGLSWGQRTGLRWG